MKSKLVPQHHCPVEVTLEVIGGKWKALILFWLRDQVCRFGELRRKIPGISERMLTKQPRELEDDGIDHRKVYPVVQPKVEYSLTAYRRTLRPITDLMCEWGEKHLRWQKEGAGRRNSCEQAKLAGATRRDLARCGQPACVWLKTRIRAR